jgi:VIT1/CCC1 family predicted Fe2+/Mn2+ transporter
MSVDSARGHRAVSVTSWVWALAVGILSFVGAVVPILSFVPIYAIPAVYAACYSGAACCITVALATWVVTLYSKVFVDHF